MGVWQNVCGCGW